MPNVKIIRHFLNNLSKQNAYGFVFGMCIYILTSALIFYFNKNVAGSRSDSSIYLNMFEYIRDNRILIPLNTYQVVSSPIFVHVFGVLTILAGNYFNLFVHFIYTVIALSSIFLIVKMVSRIEIKQSFLIIALFTSSGYFVAPSLWPTSDSPAIFFTLLSINAFLNQSKNWVFPTAIFALVSTRQSLAWLLVLFLVLDFFNNIRDKKYLFKRLLFVYSPAFLSLLITYIYFDYNLTPSIYTETQLYNVYEIPNFLSPLQIGLSLLVITVPVMLIFKITKLRHSGRSLIYFQFFLFSLLTFGILVHKPDHKIADGLSWLTILLNNLHFPLILVTFLAFIGFGLFTLFLSQLKSSIRCFCSIYVLGLSISSLIMPIPFLRYFDLYINIVILLTLTEFFKEKKIREGFSPLFLGLILLLFNFGKILL